MRILKLAAAAAWAALNSQRGHKLLGALIALVASAVAQQLGVDLPW